MESTTHERILRACLAVAVACGSGVALAAHDSGDSSMNPYTGDSYRYFNGHNLGEQGTIRPGGAPPATGYQLYPPRRPAASGAPPASSEAQRLQDERAQHPLDPSHKSARWPTSEEHP